MDEKTKKGASGERTGKQEQQTRDYIHRGAARMVNKKKTKESAPISVLKSSFLDVLCTMC